MPFTVRNRPLPLGFIEPCQPSTAAAPPSGDRWLHEIKHDGMRLMARRAGAEVRLYMRNGTNWTKRYPAVTEAVSALDVVSVHLDGEVVVCDTKGLASFDLLRSRAHDRRAFLYAFDLLELDGADLRALALEERKARLARLLRNALAGIRLAEHVEADGALVFEKACVLGCEGIVSKRGDSRYASGRSPNWIKAKNPAAAAVRREAFEDWGRKLRSGERIR